MTTSKWKFDMKYKQKPLYEFALHALSIPHCHSSSSSKLFGAQSTYKKRIIYCIASCAKAPHSLFLMTACQEFRLLPHSQS